MATSLNPGYTNNVNVVQLRTSGTGMQRVTDRDITSPAVNARKVIEVNVESDGGVNKDNISVSEFTEGNE